MKIIMNKVLCKIENCKNQTYSIGLCKKHYTSNRRKTYPEVCTIEGCERPEEAKGLCQKHYNKHWKKKK